MKTKESKLEAQTEQLDIPVVSKRYFQCWKCGAVGYTIDGSSPQNTVCCSPMVIRTSGICGGSFTIEITEQEYNERTCNAC